MAIKITLKTPDQKVSALKAEFMKNGTRFKFYPGKKVHTKNWSALRQEVLPREENHELINKYLINWKTQLSRIMAEMEGRRERLTKENIQHQLDIYLNKTSPTKKNENTLDFIDFTEAYIAKKIQNRNVVQKLEQTKRFVILANNLITKKNYEEWNRLTKNQKTASNFKADKKLPFTEINFEFIERFREYLYNVQYSRYRNGVKRLQYYKVNYISKQIKCLKQIISAAIEARHVPPFTWNSIKVPNKQVDSIYTDFREIQCLYDTILEDAKEEQARDLYVFNCYLGLRYSDLNNLAPHLFTPREVAGNKYVVYRGRAQKTDQMVEFALHPCAIRILEKYTYHLPKMRVDEFNALIKKVALKAGLSEVQRIKEFRGNETIVRDVPKYQLISSHAGRRSFCTNFYVEGVSIAAIMSISGHTTEHEFRKYIKKASVRLEVVAQQVFAVPGTNINLNVA